MKKKVTAQQKKTAKIPRFTFGIGKEKEFFIENLAMLLTSGMDILQALRAVSEEVHSRAMKNILAVLQEEIDSGSPIWRALDQTRLFPQHILALIRVGEETGKLADNLKVIVAQQEKEHIFRAQLRSAMMYPIFVLSITLVVGIGIAWFILPKLAGVFEDLDLPLPLVTIVLIAFGKFLQNYGVIAVPIGVVIFICSLYFLFVYRKTKFIGENILYRIPGIKKLMQEVEIARLGFVLGTLLEAGFPITNALSSLQAATATRVYHDLYGKIVVQIEEGRSFQRSFATIAKIRKYIPISLQHMIVAGEQSGRLAETLLHIGQMYQSKTEITTKNLSVILEPIMLIIVWLGVVGVAMAVILPIYNLIGGLNP